MAGRSRNSDPGRDDSSATRHPRSGVRGRLVGALIGVIKWAWSVLKDLAAAILILMTLGAIGWFFGPELVERLQSSR